MGQEAGDVGDRRLLPMHDAKSVADIRGCPLGPFAGQGGSLRGVLARLARIEADVLEESHVTVLEAGHCLRYGIAGDRRDECHGCTQDFAQSGRHRREREISVRGAAGPAQMGDHDDARATRPQRLDGRHTRPDTTVVPDDDRVAFAREWDIEIAAQEDHLTSDVELREPVAHRRAPTYCVRSMSRLE